jgi:predicted ArsR family transcriptional regulator
MEGTRLKILLTLQRNGQATAESLSKSLEQALATIRSHMDIPQRDSLFTYQEVKKPTDRPEYSFYPTKKGHERLPKDYPRLLGALAQEMTSPGKEEIGGKNGKELMESLLNRIAASVASRMPVTVEDNMSTRAATLTSKLESQHMMPHTEQVACGIRINVFNCPFRSIATEQDSICTFHSHLISPVIGIQVSLENCLT